MTCGGRLPHQVIRLRRTGLYDRDVAIDHSLYVRSVGCQRGIKLVNDKWVEFSLILRWGKRHPLWYKLVPHAPSTQ